MNKKSKIKKTSNIGENLKKFRVEKKFSKSKLVIKTGLDYHTIAKIENGITPDPRVATVVKIAEALNTTVEKLTALPK
jgi:transcriptional regulator with XRE-family HTH domain